MSRKYTFTALAVALGLVAGACSEQADPTSANDAGITSVTTTANARGPIVHRVSMGSSDICVGVGLSPGCDQNLSLVALEMADGTIKGQFIDVFGIPFPRGRGTILHAPVTCLSVNGNEAWVGGVITGPNFTGLPIVANRALERIQVVDPHGLGEIVVDGDGHGFAYLFDVDLEDRVLAL